MMPRPGSTPLSRFCILQFFVFLLKEKPHYTREARVMRLVEHKQKQKSVPSSYYLILFLTSFSKKPIRERERERERDMPGNC